MASRASTTATSGRVFEFGPFRLDERERLLSREGEPVALTPKVFDTLLLLVERGGRLVEKEDLMKAVWPDSFVEEVNLNRSISTLRRALGEAPNEPRYIETVPKRGYRFIAEVREVSGEASEAAPQTPAGQSRAGLEVVRNDEGGAEEAHQAKADEHVGPQVSGTRSQPIRLSGRRAAALTSLIVLALMVLAYFGTKSNPPQVEQAARPDAIGSLAVLPFKALGATEEEEYLGLGMTDVLITTLSNVKEINVRPTSAVLKYSKAEQNLVEIGRALKVDAVLEGSVQKVDDRIRVTVRLLNVNKEAPLWAGKFDEPAAGILKVQDSIAERVARALAPSLTGSEQGDSVKRYTENSEAYRLYLKGRYFWNRRTPKDYKKAIEHYEQALVKDPNYALVYAGLADAYSMLGNSTSYKERDRNYRAARTAALKALEINEGLAEAHTAMGWIKRIYEWDWSGSEKEFRRATELNPNSADAHQWYALLLTTLGRMEEAIAEIERAKALDPVSWVVSANAYAVYIRARQYDRAMTFCNEAAELRQGYDRYEFCQGTNYVRKGMYDDAIKLLQPGAKTAIGTSAILGSAYALSGQTDKAREIIDYLKARSKDSSAALYHLAMIYGDLGEKDKAFEYLEKAYNARDDRMVWLKNDPRLDSLRSDPRYDDLLRKMNLAE